MLRRQCLSMLMTFALAGCAHHAVKVNCDGVLRPINRPAPVPPTPAPLGESPSSSAASHPHTDKVTGHHER